MPLRGTITSLSTRVMPVPQYVTQSSLTRRRARGKRTNYFADSTSIIDRSTYDATAVPTMWNSRLCDNERSRAAENLQRRAKSLYVAMTSLMTKSFYKRFDGCGRSPPIGWSFAEEHRARRGRNGRISLSTAGQTCRCRSDCCPRRRCSRPTAAPI